MKKIVIAGTERAAFLALKDTGISPVHAIILLPGQWRLAMRGLKFSHADIVWGHIPPGTEFGPDFWDELELILAISS